MIRALFTAVALSCLLATAAMAQDAPALPNLVGTWEGDAAMHFRNHGYITAEHKSSSLVVERQEGPVFHGHVAWNHKSSGKDTFSGVLEQDGRTFYLVGHTEGVRIGKMNGADTFVLYVLQPGGTNPRAGMATFTRAKQ